MLFGEKSNDTIKVLFDNVQHDEQGRPHGLVQYKVLQNDVVIREFEGMAVHGKAQGHGVMKISGGYEYSGEFFESVKHGTGTEKRDGKYITTGTFVNDRLSEGMIEYAIGVKYTGRFENFRFHGQGIFEDNRKNGHKFVGNFVHGKKHGQGVMTKKGQEISGVWEHGKLIKGVYKPLSNSNQCIYEGQFKGMKFEGHGKYVCKNYTYEGNFVDGNKDGVGRITKNPLGNYPFEFIEGRFKQNLLHGLGKYKRSYDEYDGHFNEGKKDGFGVYTTRFYVYKGLFENDVKHGYGEITFKDGSKYCGHWVKGCREGDGVETLENGDVYEGLWKDGVKSGRGIETLNDGEKYTGMFKNGLRHGRGTEVCEDGSKYTGYWNKGEKSSKKRARPENTEGLLTCPICLDKNKNVVMDLCRHTFCGDCIDMLKSKSLLCPLCKKGNNRVEPIFL